MLRSLHLLPLLSILSVGCSKYPSRGDLTRDDAANQLNNWQSLVIRPAVFGDETFQCGLRSGLWKYAGEPHSGVIITPKGDLAGFRFGFELPAAERLGSPYTAKLQAQYFNTVTGIADADTPSTKLVEYTWKFEVAWPNKDASQALKDCFPDGSIQGEDKATFRHFDDGWRLMWFEGKYLKR